jgi:hypothetical protein
MSRPAEDRQWRRVVGTPRRLWIVSAGPDAAAAAEIYRPLRIRAKYFHKIHHVLTSTTHARRVLGQRYDPSPMVQHHLVTPFLSGASGLAQMVGSSQRTIVGVARNGRLTDVLKIGSAADVELANEAFWLANPPEGVAVPVLRDLVVGDEIRILVLDAIDGFWRTPLADVSCAMDVCVRLQSLGRPIVHGDLAPWNVVQGSLSKGHVPSEPGRQLPLVIDWERARYATEPLTDLTQFLVQQHQLERRWNAQAIVTALTEQSGPGWRCLHRLGIDPTTARSHLAITLQSGIGSTR